MLDKLFRKAAKAQSKKGEPTEGKVVNAEGEEEEALDETGTFMLDVSQLKDSEDLEDLLKDL